MISSFSLSLLIHFQPPKQQTQQAQQLQKIQQQHKQQQQQQQLQQLQQQQKPQPLPAYNKDEDFDDDDDLDDDIYASAPPPASKLTTKPTRTEYPFLSLRYISSRPLSSLLSPFTNLAQPHIPCLLECLQISHPTTTPSNTPTPSPSLFPSSPLLSGPPHSSLLFLLPLNKRRRLE